MKNEYRNPQSKFNKLYARDKKTVYSSVELDKDRPDETLNELDREKAIEAIAIVSKKFPLETKILNEASLSTIVEVSKKSGIHRQTIEKICKFVRKQIVNEYNRINNL